MKYILIFSFLSLCLSAFSQDTVSHEFSTHYYEQYDMEIPSIRCKINYDILKEEYRVTDHIIGVNGFVDYDFLKIAKEIIDKDTVTYLMHFFAEESPCMFIDLAFTLPKGARINLLNRKGQSNAHYTSDDNWIKKRELDRGVNIGNYRPGYIISIKIPKKSFRKTRVQLTTLYPCTSRLKLSEF